MEANYKNYYQNIHRGTITTTLGFLAVTVYDVFVVNFVVYKKGLVQFSQLEANSNAKS
jgi:hypothetical protein